MLTDYLDVIRKEAVSYGDGYVRRFEDALAHIVALHDPACIGPLLGFVDDNAEYDELMFSIVHTIETFDDTTYVVSVIDSLDSLFARSPRWATVIHIRSFNCAPALAEYSRHIASMPRVRLESVRKVIDAVRRRNHRLSAQCDSLQCDPPNTVKSAGGQICLLAGVRNQAFAPRNWGEVLGLTQRPSPK